MTEIKTWHERAMEHPDHQTGTVSDEMIRARMCEEIEELRARIENLERVCAAAQLLIDRWSQSERSDWYCGIADLRAQKPHARWYADQKQAAQRDYDDARAALEAKP
jgi:hypothetical protein